MHVTFGWIRGALWIRGWRPLSDQVTRSVTFQLGPLVNLPSRQERTHVQCSSAHCSLCPAPVAGCPPQSTQKAWPGHFGLGAQTAHAPHRSDHQRQHPPLQTMATRPTMQSPAEVKVTLTRVSSSLHQFPALKFITVKQHTSFVPCLLWFRCCPRHP